MKNKTLYILITVLLFTFSLITNLFSEPTQSINTKKTQKYCPVTDTQINKRIFVETHGKRVYLADEKSVIEFNKDPKKYLKKVYETGYECSDSRKPTKEPVVNWKPQTKCPITQDNIDREIFIEYKGKIIFFAKNGLESEFKKNADKIIKTEEEKGIVFLTAENKMLADHIYQNDIQDKMKDIEAEAERHRAEKNKTNQTK